MNKLEIKLRDKTDDNKIKYKKMSKIKKYVPLIINIYYFIIIKIKLIYTCYYSIILL